MRKELQKYLEIRDFEFCRKDKTPFLVNDSGSSEHIIEFYENYIKEYDRELNKLHKKIASLEKSQNPVG